MAEFGASATLEVEVDQATLRQARAEVEDELGDISVSVDGPSGGGGSPGPPVADGGAGLSRLAEINSEQVDLLDEILEELETGGVGGGGGGGPGGGGGLIPFIGGEDGGLDFGDAATGGLLARLLGGVGGGGALGLGALLGPAAGAGGLLAGGATLPGLLNDEIDIGGESLATTLTATPAVQLAGLGAQGLGGLTDLIGGAGGDGGPVGAPFDRSGGPDAPGGAGLDPLINSFETQGEAFVSALGALTSSVRQQARSVDEGEQGVDLSTGFPTPNETVDTGERGVDLATGFPLSSRSSGDPVNPAFRGGGANTGAGPNRAAERQQRRQDISVDVQNDIRAEVDLDGLRDLQQFLRNPERFVEDALGVRGNRVRGP